MATASAFDFDIVIWDVDGTAAWLSEHAYRRYMGRPSLNDDLSVQLVEAITRRKREFTELLALGRAVCVLVGGEYSVYVGTGERETSGTGRNQKVTRLVEAASLLDAVPHDLEVTPGWGLELEAVHPSARALLSAQDDDEIWSYRAVLDRFPGDPVFRVSGTDKIVASILRTDAGGMLALMPEPITDHDATLDEPAASKEGSLPFLLRDWLRSFSGDSNEPAPEWLQDYRFHSQLDRLQKLAQLEKRVATALQKIDRLKLQDEEDERWKRLIHADGAALEAVTREAFELLGFPPLRTGAGRSDLHLVRNGKHAVVEVKGTTKSAAEQHCAQLEKWVAEELSHGVSAKGILVVNAWRARPPRSRTAKTFPPQMVPYAEARGHCLITGLQLLSMVLAVQTGQAHADDVAEGMFICNGVLAGWDDVEVIFPTERDVSS